MYCFGEKSPSILKVQEVYSTLQGTAKYVINSTLCNSVSHHLLEPANPIIEGRKDDLGVRLSDFL
jgi:hypothetical protein